MLCCLSTVSTYTEKTIGVEIMGRNVLEILVLTVLTYIVFDGMVEKP